jgi:hypothetical protein
MRQYGSARPSKASDRAMAVHLAYNAREIPSVDLLMQRYRLTRADAQEIIAKATVSRG